MLQILINTQILGWCSEYLQSRRWRSDFCWWWSWKLFPIWADRVSLEGGESSWIMKPFEKQQATQACVSVQLFGRIWRQVFITLLKKIEEFHTPTPDCVINEKRSNFHFCHWLLQQSFPTFTEENTHGLDSLTRSLKALLFGLMETHVIVLWLLNFQIEFEMAFIDSWGVGQ